MPRTTKTAAAAGSPEREAGEPRRSSRIKAQPAPPPPAKKKAATKPKPRAKKAKDDEGDDKKVGEKREAEDAENGDEPEKKKAKSGSEKPASKASRAGSAKPGDAKKAAAAEPATETIAEEGEDDDGDKAEVKALEVGDVLPDITLKNEKDEDVSIKSLAEETGIVLFLFPKADTPGCTKQACGYRDIYKQFQDVGYTVYGLSTDPGAATLKWQTKKTLPYSFLSDPNKELITALGVSGGKSAKRSHFIFGKGGKLLDKKLPVKPEDSPKLALEFIKSQSA